MEHSQLLSTGRSSTRLHATPGGNQSFNLFGAPDAAAENKQPNQARAAPTNNIFGSAEPAAAPARKNQSNVSTLQLTDEPPAPSQRPSTRVHAQPGGNTSFNVFGGPVSPAPAPAPAAAPAPAPASPAPVASPEPQPEQPVAAPAAEPAPVAADPAPAAAPEAAPAPVAAPRMPTNNIFGSDAPAARSSTTRMFTPGGKQSMNIFGAPEPAAPPAANVAPASSAPYVDDGVGRAERPRSGKKQLGPGAQATSDESADQTFRPTRKLLGPAQQQSAAEEEFRPTRKLLGPGAAAASAVVAPAEEEQPVSMRPASGRKQLDAAQKMHASNIFAAAPSDEPRRARHDNNKPSEQSPWNAGPVDAPTSQPKPRNAPAAAVRRSLFPNHQPFNTGYLAVDDTHKLYFEQSGNPNGQPAVFLHDGPGGIGSSDSDRRLFNPTTYRAVLFDQRGAGRSTPSGSLQHTIWDLVADIEKLRNHLKIDQWVVVGSGWGATLALTYAIQHPDKVKGLILNSIVTATNEELFFGYSSGVNLFFPEAWEQFVAPIPVAERETLIDAYYKRLTGADPAEREAAARAWINFHHSISRVSSDDSASPEEKVAVGAASTRAYYLQKSFFFESDGWLLANAAKLADVPGIVIHGRFDAVSPIKSAYDLHKAWTGSEYIVVPDAGHSSREAGIVHHLVTSIDRFSVL